MAKVSEPRLGGLTKEQEREVADQLERSLGLNPKHGWFRNIDNILANRKKVYGMLDEDWDKMFRELPYYGEFQAQDIDAIQEYFLDKYPIKKVLGLPVRQKMNLFDTETWPTNWKSIGETYGIEAGVIPSDEAYQKIMSISPDALSGVKATGLDSYEGPIAGTIEYEDPRQQRAVEGVPSFDNTGIYRQDLSISDFKDLGIGGAGKFTRMIEGMTDQEKIDADLMDDPVFQRRIDEVQESAEKERMDKRFKQKRDAERRARQYDAIAKRLWT